LVDRSKPIEAGYQVPRKEQMLESDASVVP